MSQPEPHDSLTPALPMPAGAALALAEILTALPERWLPLSAELRAPGTSPEPGPLIERVTVDGATPPEPRVSGGELDAARRRPGPAVLRDHSQHPQLRAWIRVPLRFRDVPSPLYLYIGSCRDAGDLANEDLEGLAKLVRKHTRDASNTSVQALSPLFQSLAEAVPVPVLVTDTDGCMVGLNSNLRFSMGRHEPIAPGTPLETVVPAAHLPYFREALVHALETGASAELPLPCRGTHSNEIAFTLSANMASAGPGRDVVIFVLREVSSGLELTRLAEKDRMQNYVLQALIHDVRTPLTAVASGVEYLQSALPNLSAADDDEERQSAEEILAVVRQSAAQIDHLLRDLGDFVEVRSGGSDRLDEVESLAELTREALEPYRLGGLGSRLVLRVAQDGKVAVQRHRFARALDNLISNALKYSPEDQPVELVVGAGLKPGTISLEIHDRGVGISPEYLQKIWDPFYRMRSAATSGIAGSGLGLSIVRQIVESHDGEIDVTSELGQGSTFRITLPVHS